MIACLRGSRLQPYTEPLLACLRGSRLEPYTELNTEQNCVASLSARACLRDELGYASQRRACLREPPCATSLPVQRTCLHDEPACAIRLRSKPACAWRPCLRDEPACATSLPARPCLRNRACETLLPSRAYLYEPVCVTILPREPACAASQLARRSCLRDPACVTSLSPRRACLRNPVCGNEPARATLLAR